MRPSDATHDDIRMQIVDFANILIMYNFLHATVFQSFSLFTVWICTHFIAKEYQGKICS